MKNKELIKRIDDEMFLYPAAEPETAEDPTVEFKKGFNCACEKSKRLVEQKLDEPKKVVVPRAVAEWIEYAKKKGDSLSASFKPWDLYGAEYGKVNSWIKDNEETYARAWLDGYEVEKEQLYYVKFDILYLQKYLVKNVETDQFYLSNNEKVVGNYEQVRFTEQEIKAIDERYWPFAVKVDGE
ncbi:DUF1642 domain-containing protein [Enterococcus faecalis]|nr:DUF1642 domain-containing protein [Enterococcus faecalis]NST42999.1 DUF1642 domain-containing protein [Enterococcus faecalis]